MLMSKNVKIFTSACHRILLSYLLIHKCLSMCQALDSNLSPPRIEFQKWLADDEYQWKTIESINDGVPSDIYTKVDNENIYDLGLNTQGIFINCSASYPVQWVPYFKKGFTSAFGSILSGINIYSVREFDDFNNILSYRYSSLLTIASYYKELTANYSCQSVANHSLKSDIYLYVDGDSEEKLIFSGQTIELPLENKKVLELPCSVSSPYVEVALQKEELQAEGFLEFVDWVPLSSSGLKLVSSDGITYNPITGFTMRTNDPSSLLGSYRCITENEDDFVIINVVSDRKTSYVVQGKSQDLLNPPAKLEFDKENQRMVCCSDSNNPPKLTLLYCKSILTCKIWDTVNTFDAGGQLQIVTEKITTNGSCTYNQFYGISNAKVICEGDGVNVRDHIFYSFVQENRKLLQYPAISPQFDMHFLGENVSLEKEISIQVSGGLSNVNGVDRSESVQLKSGDTVQIYSKEIRYFSCRASPYFFAHMVIWSIQLQNKTKIIPQLRLPDLADYQDVSVTLSLNAHEVISSLTCHSPVWNSSDWVNSTVNLKIIPSVKPQIAKPASSVVTWTINSTDMMLRCEIDNGLPVPTMTWLRDGKELKAISSNGKWVELHLNGTLTLKFHRVTTDIHGEYICEARNVAGVTTQSFSIIVEEPYSSFVIWIVATIVLILLMGLGIVIWKARIYRVIANNMMEATTKVF